MKPDPKSEGWSLPPKLDEPDEWRFSETFDADGCVSGVLTLAVLFTTFLVLFLIVVRGIQMLAGSP